MVAEGVFRLDKISGFVVVLKIQVKWTVGVSSVVVIDSVVEKGLVEELDRAIFGRGWFDSKLKFEVFINQVLSKPYHTVWYPTCSYDIHVDRIIYHTSSDQESWEKEKVTAAADLWFWRQCSWRQLKYQKFAYNELRSSWVAAVCRPRKRGSRPINPESILPPFPIGPRCDLFRHHAHRKEGIVRVVQSRSCSLLAPEKNITNIVSCSLTYSYDFFDHIEWIHRARSFHWPSKP